MHIVDTYRESFSAKAPGRTLFNEMLTRIERGEADGIISWHPDRLARNSVDGGRIIYMLDRKLLKDLKFATFSFENNSQGKFMLSIIFGYSKYYVDSLSENVKRGNRAKVERGWRPSPAPIGYKHDLETRTVVPDPHHFPIIKRIFDLALTGNYSMRDLCLLARDEWAYRTPKHQRMGGKPLSTSTLYRIFSNRFYSGTFLWAGVFHQGKHQPMISSEDFERVQHTIGKRGVKRPRKHDFAFTGLMRCGKCGLRITAEMHRNRFGTYYTYYHCTKRILNPRCDQPYLEAKKLEAQLVQFISAASIHPELERWLVETGLRRERMSQVSTEEARASIERSVDHIEKQISSLTDLRVLGYIEEAEFIKRHEKLQSTLLAARSRHEKVNNSSDWFEPLVSVISFSKCAVPWFIHGDNETKRTIIKTVGSNPTLLDNRVSICMAKPFVLLSESDGIPGWSAKIKEVRRLIEERDPDTLAILQSIKMLEVRKGLIAPPLLLRAQAEEVDEETSDTC